MAAPPPVIVGARSSQIDIHSERRSLVRAIGQLTTCSFVFGLVSAEEHIPHAPIGATVGDRALAEATHEIKTQEVADGVFLHTYQNTDGPPLLVTYRVETKIEESVTITMSFEGSENIGILPQVPGLTTSRCALPSKVLYLSIVWASLGSGLFWQET